VGGVIVGQLPDKLITHYRHITHYQSLSSVENSQPDRLRSGLLSLVTYVFKQQGFHTSGSKSEPSKISTVHLNAMGNVV